ncbi:MAG: M20/M25/M40 family metallo-hydrolase [Crocinitomix sp.]|nr:M20/M25/M40 family metallo-hydrolase [Crocinitomix sp.]
MKKLLFCIGLNTFLMSVSFAQQAYAKVIIDSLCSEHYDGRGYVNQGDNRAADFIIRELETIGVTPFKKRPFAQPYRLNVNTFPYPIEVILGNDTLVPGADYLINPSSGSAQGEFELVEINSENLQSKFNGVADLSLQSTTQKIFAFNFTDIKDSKKRNKIKAFAYKAMNYFPVIWVEQNKQMYSVGRREFNYPLISIDSANYFAASTVKLKINNAYKPQYLTKNVIGFIPGKKKRKYIVLSAHYDHLGRMGTEAMFPGANDNASGVAMLLSMAKHFMANRPEYSIVLCFFSGEEAGLEGSKYFVQHPYIKLKKIQFVLNVDIMGGAGDGITLVNGTEHEDAFNTMVEINSEKKYLERIKKRGPTANSDHYFFSQSGIPAFFIYSMGSVRNYHDIYDTAENTPLNKFDEVQALLIDFIKTL